MLCQIHIMQRVRQLLGIKHAILSAPMAGASGAALATQVTKAGGLGFLAGGYGETAVLGKELKLWHRLSAEHSSGASGKGVGIPVGVGFVSWVFDKVSE